MDKNLLSSYWIEYMLDCITCTDWLFFAAESNFQFVEVCGQKRKYFVDLVAVTDWRTVGNPVEGDC